MPDAPLPTTNASPLTGALPTILSPAVATLLNATVQSPMLVTAPQPLAVGMPPIYSMPPPKSKLPWILSGVGVLGLGIAGLLLLRKKRRK